MAKQIKISGTIVGSEWDDPAFESYIAKGVFTPESRFCKALEEANGEDVEVWVNSYGGSVMAGNEMLARFQSYKGYKCVTVGSFAASMAANFILQCGCRVECHENTIVLFHSARTSAEGSADALRDEAAMIDQINGPIKKRLCEHGVPEDIVEAGFAEGRQFTLGAEDLLRYGIVAKVIKGAAPAPERISAGEPRLAALATLEDILMEEQPTQEAAPVEETVEAAEPIVTETPEQPEAAPVQEAEPAPAAEEPVTEEAAPVDEPEQPAAPVEAEAPVHEDVEPEAPVHEEPTAEALMASLEKAEANVRSIQSSCAKEINRVKADAEARIAEILAERDAARVERENTLSELASLKEQLAAAQARADSLVSNVLQPRSEAMDGVSPASMKADLLAQMRSLPMAQWEAFYKAHKGQF